MASSLPTFPRLVFTILEPISLLAGFLGTIYDAGWFVAQQIPSEPMITSENSLVVTWQLGNLYLLLALIGVAVLSTTSEVKVVRNYLVALWIADIGHVAISCYGLGRDRALDPLSWNAMAWGNIGATIFLFLTRSAYLIGLFGPHEVQVPAVMSNKHKKA